MTPDRHSPIYDELMRFKPDGLTPNGWAVLSGVSRTVWSDMRRHGNPSRRTLEKLLSAAGSSLAEFEALRIGRAPNQGAAGGTAIADPHREWRIAPSSGLSLVATRMGGEWKADGSRIELTVLRPAEVIDRLPRPASLANDASAYAVTIVGDSMWPRFRPGRRIAVSAKAPVAVGDDVLVKLKGGGESADTLAVPVLIKELVRRTATGFELRQFNPTLTFEVTASDIAATEKVLGELI